MSNFIDIDYDAKCRGSEGISSLRRKPRVTKDGFTHRATDGASQGTDGTQAIGIMSDLAPDSNTANPADAVKQGLLYVVVNVNKIRVKEVSAYPTVVVREGLPGPISKALPPKATL